MPLSDVHGPAKLGQNSGFMRALAQPRVLQSQSQAIRPWLVGAQDDHLPVFARICSWNIKLYLVYQLCINTPTFIPCHFPSTFFLPSLSLWLLIYFSALSSHSSFLLNYMYNIICCGLLINYL